MERKYGFRLLDDSHYRQRLDSELRRIGYSLGDYHTDESFLRELEIPIEPLGNNQRLCLRLTQDAHQDWAFGTLVAASKPGDELTDFHFDSRIQYAVSCYYVWLDSIVDAVRLTTQT